MKKDDIRYKTYIKILEEESTIRGIGRLGKDGMRETNEEIIKLMVNEDC